MWIFRFKLIAVVLWGLVLIQPQIAIAQDPSGAISSGAQWLLDARYTLGYWALSSPPSPDQTEFTSDDINTSFLRDSIEAINSLQTIQMPFVDYENSFHWLENSVVRPAWHLSLKTKILYLGGTDPSDLLSTLLTYNNVDGGFGGAIGFPSDIQDTAFALEAITVADVANTGARNGAVNYLIFNQNPNGGWGFIPGKQSEVYYTALAMQALSIQPQTTAIANALSQGTTFLLAHQNADGGFGSSPSTVWETAQVFLAISKTTGDAAVRTAAIDYLLAQQQANGSWDGDPYSTALAIQALYAAQNQTGPQVSNEKWGKRI